MMRTDFEKWVQGYLKAWETNTRAHVEALFTEDATYLTQAFREPWGGREAIIEGWLGRADFQVNWSFDYEWIAVEGDTGVLEGVTVYKDEDEYANVWIIRLAEDGRCREFREHWVRKSEVS